MRRAVALAALALAAAAGCDRPFVVTPELRYDASIGYEGAFDLYEPLGDGGRADRPVVVAIHGGAWRGGDKAWGEAFAEELCPRGYVVLSINYRRAGPPGSTWPAQIEDVRKALRHLRANARRYRVDPSRVATLGMSAGGHLATMAALREDPAGDAGRVRVAVNLDGEHDMTMPPARVMDDFEDIMTQVLGHPAPWSAAELRDISTVTFARPDAAVLTVHGTGDDNVYVDQGERLTAALRAAGATTEFVRLDGDEGECHEECWRVPRARRALHAFLDRELRHDGDAFAARRAGAR
ncbi:alpha/beta hydrolase [Roseisolibacter sp. H3M3-2]|uniref:alpha/beta hydrolase n=1 Tax=Roseisolibacter sp. H3M3-2 TaxID=3031323 RepID=UPI0023DC73A1|nr:alpha/beta hydrolase [Roseisolibacter sp. H3M3-2]MDF1501414.1 alpha/beta hydrolase [Roseisolibacter sp. H3M3-2]